MKKSSDHIHQVQFFMLNSALDPKPDFNKIQKKIIRIRLFMFYTIFSKVYHPPVGDDNQSSAPRTVRAALHI